MQQFQAEIKQVEGKDASYIEIPFDVEEIYGKKRVKVKATFDGVSYRGSIVKMGLPCYMIGMTKEIRKAIGKSFGDIVIVTVEEDKEERQLELPEEFMNELGKQEQAKQFWESLSYSAQRKFVQWITSAKKEETRLKRIQSSIEKLEHHEKIS
ncbi:hypothetical protein lbkm_0452 [Lachnospiraceae bacterium KM106-2]|nr:hypothetical protein lbkm_0452 [Lachnospiraceae bacterium KM106-2]